MSLPSTELANIVTMLEPATRNGLSARGIEALLVMLMSIRAQVAQLETCTIPAHLQAAANSALTGGNVFRFTPRPSPAPVPPEGGAA